MQIDIANHIEKLLFLHDALTIPSFGAFTARPTVAQADYAGGTVVPPSKTLTFNENITTDDGLLIQDVAKTNGVSSEQARQTVQVFVENIQEMLNRREIVTLPGIGRLYKNYVQKIQFLPDAANFNAESFGLPPLQFSPIARSREVVDGVTGIENTKTTGRSSELTFSNDAHIASDPKSNSSRQLVGESAGHSGAGGVVPMLIVILILLCAMAGYWVWKQGRDIKEIADNRNETEKVGSTAQEKPTDYIPKPSTKPPKIEQPPSEKPANTSAESAEEKKEYNIDKGKGESLGKHECILIVATLQEEINADRLVGMLESEGYKVYFLRKGGFQVGIQFRYDHLSQVQEKIVALQKLTGEQNIWIKKR